MKNIGTKELKTERLYLRKVKSSDADYAYNAWCKDKDVAKYVIWDVHSSVEVTKHLFEIWEKEYEKDTTYRWLVCLKDSEEILGAIDVAGTRYLKYGSCEIGYVYKKDAWSNGYATEALKAVIKFLFEECDACTIYAEHMENNMASGKVMKKSGMTYEGKLRDRIYDKDGELNSLLSYSITKEEYFNNK